MIRWSRKRKRGTTKRRKKENSIKRKESRIEKRKMTYKGRVNYMERQRREYGIIKRKKKRDSRRNKNRKNKEEIILFDFLLVTRGIAVYNRKRIQKRVEEHRGKFDTEKKRQQKRKDKELV